MEEMINNDYYSVPKIDKALSEQGWIKFRNNPVYYRDMSDWGQPGRYKLFFPLDFKAHFLLYLRDDVSDDIFNKAMINLPPVMPSMITDSNKLDKALLLWTSDFYRWQNDFEKSVEYENEYNNLK